MAIYRTESVNVDANELYATLFKTKTFRKEDIIIMLVGDTGSGKSQIIDTLSGQIGQRARASLHSATYDIGAFRILDHERYGSRIILVDTPGFEHTSMTDKNILNRIGEWLEKIYTRGILPSGIVYVHSITERRMASRLPRHLPLFSELVGFGGAKNLLLTTTMWDKLNPKLDDRNAREMRLKEKIGNDMIDYGAAVLVERFLNTSDSAWKIIDKIVNENDKKSFMLTSAPGTLPLGLRELIPRRSYAALIARLDPSAPAVTGVDKNLTRLLLSQNRAYEDHYLKARPTFDHVSREDTLPMHIYKTELVQTSKLGDDDIIIAFMGPTGSGKSQIIDTLTGQQGGRAGDNLESVTQDLEASRILDHERYGSRIVLVDTPGFDDSTRTDKQILDLIGEWLTKTYEKRILLSGIVYVHRMTSTRMAATPHRNLLMFSELTGHRGAKNVVLATTMWDRLHPSLDDGSKREKEIKEEYWKAMIHHGAAVYRFLNTPDSAWRIVDNVVNKSNHKGALLFQEERVDQEKCLEDTRAGKALVLDLAELIEKQNRTFGYFGGLWKV